MFSLYYCLKEYIKEDSFSYSLNEYDLNKKSSICLILRDGGNSYRELSSGKYFNTIYRVEIVGVAGRSEEEILFMEEYMSRIREKLEILNNKQLESGEHKIFVSSTSTGEVNYLGKNKQEFSTFSLNALIIYK